ncbi:GumC family protein [Aurantimonas endophytica]|uniref:non-specific protein-tyrosine kinase n=1 Tax=Aurantimonas endophytica TaxID=1522175 RepID=A0A7W6HGP6_9HYPH|nr:polysaccharide biosynthesis tyrosine autokinase [Aurantimonas endophytica]MBB4004837.1 capsular exopolysaccharide synthesis family protein [Aurantimonas endophytica]MCO6405647.1 polysaccharide biosynthesis tyrosine autokinase [Aurantimonas endophytica]
MGVDALSLEPADDFYRAQYARRPEGLAQAEEGEAGFDPLRLFYYLLQYRWLILAAAVLAIIVGMIVTLMQTPKYEAAARLEILVPSAKVFDDLQVVSEGTDLRAFLTAREKIRSRALAERVVYELNLSENANFLFPEPNIAVSNLFDRAFGRSEPRSLDDIAPEARERLAIARVRENLSAELVNNTSLMTVTFRDQNPEIAQQVVNQAAQSFIDQRLDQTSETSSLARQFIQEQVLQVKDRLQSSEEELVAYAKSEGLTIDDSNSSLILNSIRDINQALSQAVRERLDKGRWVTQIDAGSGASLPQVLESQGIQNLRDRVAELRSVYQQKLGTLKPAYPEMRQLSAQIGELESQIEQAIDVVTSSIRLEFQDAQTSEKQLRAELAELEAQQADFQDRNIRYTILKREVDSNRSQYESLIAKLNEVGVGSELRNQNAAIVDAAAVPRSPYSPRMPMNMAMSLALFMAGTAGFIYLRELLDNTFTVPAQLESELRLPVLGILPAIPVDGLDDALMDQQSALSEAYRSLRTSLQFTGTEGTPKSLLVTSSEASEGKSTSTYKLAEDFAVLGAKVLVIDADLRKPSLHRMFNTSNTIGLSNLLTSTISAEDMREIFKNTRFDNVRLLTSGTLPPNPADLLSSPKMAQLMRLFAERFDMIIIDAPPVLGLSDAPILSRLTEGTLLIVSSGQVGRKHAAAAVKRLRSTGANVIGAALTKLEVKKFDYNHGYGYVNSGYYTYDARPARLEDGSRGEKRDGIQKTISHWLRRIGFPGMSGSA